MQPLDFLLIVLSALTLHRIWNYEKIIAPTREFLEKIPYLRKPLLCAACNAFWFGGGAVALWYFTHPAVLITLASFMPMRVLVWIYQKLEKTNTPTVAPVHASAVPATPQVMPPPVIRTYERRVVILTALGDFRSSYSVATVIFDQAMSIALTHPMWEVQVWVMQGAQEQGWAGVPVNMVLKKVIPPNNWAENRCPEDEAVKLKDTLLAELVNAKVDTIITHDLLFVTWYALFARAIHLIGASGGFKWFHIPHSLPSSREGKNEFLIKLPEGKHQIVTVAKGYEQQFADYYAAPREKVHRIANPRDPRAWGTMSNNVKFIATKLKLWEYDLVQIFPVCTTRLEAKGFSKLIKTFAYMNETKKAFLLVCNPNAGGERSEAIIRNARITADKLGLSRDRWAFLSDHVPAATTYGLDADEIKSLMYAYGNVMIFPSMSEADSLLLREAQLAGHFTVGNSDVSTLKDEADYSIPFGTTVEVDVKVCSQAAATVLACVRDFRRRQVLKERNLEVIGNQWGSLITTAGP